MTMRVPLQVPANNPQIVEMDSAIIPGFISYGIHANHMASGVFRRIISHANNPGHDQIQR